LVAFTQSQTATQAPAVGIEISEIRGWIEDAGLAIQTTNILPGDALDISLLVSEKTKERA
jgi:hypothetical protein